MRQARSRRDWGAMVRVLCACGIALALTNAPVRAQASEGLPAVTYATSMSSVPQILTASGKVNLDVVGVPLAEALEKLVRAGAPLVYSTDLVAGVPSVSCYCVNQPLRSVLRTLLTGTGIDYQEVEDTGQLLLIPAPRPELRPVVGAVRGMVREQSGDPVADASIEIVGTGRGAVTDRDGAYLIANVPAGQRWIKASQIGFRADSQRVMIRDGSTVEVDFVLAIDPMTMNPLTATVSTGSMAETERKQIGNSVLVISEEQIQTSGARSVPELLRGRAIGVDVARNSGANGAGGHIQIRGVGSIIQDQAPLIYVDGVPVDAGSGALSGRGTGTNAFNAADPNLASQLRIDELTLDQIDRIEIIKGPAATTLYGTQGSNGVIQIFTKRGVTGQTRITARVEQGVSMLRNDGELGADLPYRDAFLSQFRNPRVQAYHVGLTGGTGDISYSLGATHDRDDGYIPNNGEERTALSTSLNILPTEDLSIRLSGTLLRRHFSSSTLYPGSPTVSPEEYAKTAPVSDTDVSRMYGSLALRYQPHETWTNRLVIGVDENTEVNDRVGVISDEIVRDRVSRDFRRLSGNFITTLAYPRTGPITSTFSAGGEAYSDETVRLRMQGVGLPDARVTDFDLATSITGGDLFIPTDLSTTIAQVGGFLQEQIGLYDRFFLTLGVRADGNSAFGDDYGMQVYPKLAAAYVLEPLPWWSAKLRSAWGKSGQAPPPFAKDLTFGLTRPPQTGRPTLILTDPGNPDLRPEIGSEWEVGVENYFFGNRASLELNYFRQTTTDAHIRVPVPLSTGMLAGPLGNVGELRSEGLELAMRVTPLDRPATGVDVGFTLTHMFENGLITDLGEDPVLTRYNQGFPMANFEGLQEGLSVRDLYFTSIWEDTVHEGVYQIIAVGSRVPTTFGGANVNVRFLDRARVYANLIYNLGGHGFDRNRFNRDRALGYLGLAPNSGYSTNRFPPELQDRYVFRTDQLKLDVLRLMLQLPGDWASRLSAHEAEFWVEGANLLSFDVYDRGDPESVPVESNSVGITGMRGIVAPRPQTYTLGFRVTF